MNSISSLSIAQQLPDSTNVLDTREKRFFNNVLDTQVFPATGNVSDQSQNEAGESILDISEKRYFNRLLNAQIFQPNIETESSEPLGETVLDQTEKLYFNTMLHDEVFSSQESVGVDAVQTSDAERVLDSQERRYFNHVAQFGAMGQEPASAGLTQGTGVAAAKGSRINVKL